MKTIEVKKQRLLERIAHRMGRSDRDQLALIKERRGESLKEKGKIAARIVREKNVVSSKGPEKAKSDLPSGKKAKFKKGAKKNA